MSGNAGKFVRLLVFVALSALTTQVGAQEPLLSKPGQLLKVEALRTYSKEQLDTQFGPLGQARNGISVYRVEYQSLTPEAAATPVVLSGIILLPDSIQRELPWISVQHGTVIPQGQAPSAKPGLGFFEAAQGYVTLVPDYLGYGRSRTIRHPYLIAKGYTQTGVHFLRAAQAFLQQKGIKPGELFLQGYSEGGYATLALQKELESRHAHEFQLIASAPGAGPYDMEQLAVDGLRAPTQNPLATAFILLALQRWTAPSLDLTAIINSDVAKLSDMLNADELDPKAVEALPTASRAFIFPEFLDDFVAEQPQTETARLVRGLFVEQSLNRGSWSPRIPTRFMHCQDDEVVAVSFTENIVKHFNQVDPAAPVVSEILVSPDPNQPYRHGNCPLIFAPVRWFDTLRQGAAAAAAGL